MRNQNNLSCSRKNKLNSKFYLTASHWYWHAKQSKTNQNETSNIYACPDYIACQLVIVSMTTEDLSLREIPHYFPTESSSTPQLAQSIQHRFQDYRDL